jgi:hypothetical protein
MAQALASSPCRANAVSLSNVSEARSRGSSRRKTAIIAATVSAADLPARRAARTRRLLRSLSARTGRVRLQIRRPPSQCPASPHPLDGRGPIVDGAPIGDGRARLASPPPAPLGAPPRQQSPELLALLPGPVKEGVDRLGGDGTQPALLAPLEPAGDPLRGPALQEALAHEAAELGVPLQDRRPLAGGVGGGSPRRGRAGSRPWATRSAAARG